MKTLAAKLALAALYLMRVAVWQYDLHAASARAAAWRRDIHQLSEESR